MTVTLKRLKRNKKLGSKRRNFNLPLLTTQRNAKPTAVMDEGTLKFEDRKGLWVNM